MIDPDAPPTPPVGAEVRCSDGCGRMTTEPSSTGWSFLSISNRWRCAQCWRELQAVNLSTMQIAAVDETAGFKP